MELDQQINQAPSFWQKLKKKWQNLTGKISDWMDKGNRTTVIFLLPYVAMFTIFIVLPVIVAMFLSFTYFNGVSEIKFTGFTNYIFVFTQDQYFMRTILPNTILFAICVGPGGYVLSFLLAWILSQIAKLPRTIMTLIVYSPSMTSGIAMTVLWKIIFSGDEQGYLNSILLQWDLISEPIQWLQSGDFLMPVMIIVTLWGSMGVGFLAMLSGILSINRELYEAAYLDGISNRFQEIIYITVPAMKNQMLFGAVMAIVNAFTAGAIGVQLTGSNPTPNYAGQMIVNHIDDYGILRKELGMSAALSVILLIIVYLFSWIFRRLFSDND